MFHCGKGFHLLIYMDKTALYPMGFGPILKQMIWGGNRILSYKSLVLNMSNIGESWELSGVPGNESVVSNGEFAETTLANKELGWKAERTIEETLASAWAWEKNLSLLQK